MSASAPAADREHTGLILVVEDYDLLRSLVRMILEDEGYDVVDAADGAAALALTRTMAPALILLDVAMPVLDGPGFVAAYRARPGPHAPIVLMTAARDDPRWLTALGTIGHIRKPFDLDELVRVVANVVGAPRSARSVSP
jgi:CheY-like chemotaxis protein